MGRPKVLIVGAGFAGLECARTLDRGPADVLLVDRNNYHLFTPLLYQVAGSLLNPGDICYPVRAVFRGSPNVRFRMATIVSADFGRRVVVAQDGSELAYDRLVLCAGSRTNYFGLASLQEVSYPLKDLHDALRLRSHILRCLEEASRRADPAERRPWLSFFVAGGGPTGVEYAGALSELIRVVAREFPELDMSRVRIALLEATGEVLPAFPAALGRKARRELERRGIEVLLAARVLRADKDSVTLQDGRRLEGKTLVWAAGVRGPMSAARLGLPLSRSGRVVVEPTLQVQGLPEVYAAGDMAGFVQGGRETPMLARPAIRQARHAARNVLRELEGLPPEPFVYRDPGAMATIGRNAAVARVGRLNLSGFVGWVAWLFVHLYFLIGFRNRLVVLWGWAWDYMRLDRPVRHIAKVPEPERDEA